MPLTALTVLKGATAYLDECWKISIAAVGDDQDEEIESMDNSLQIDNVIERVSQTSPQAGTSSGPAQKHHDARMAEATMGDLDEDTLAQNLKIASAGVILESTLSNYRR